LNAHADPMTRNLSIVQHFPLKQEFLNI